MIRINLLPLKAAQKRERLRNHLAAFVVSILLTLSLCAGAYVYVAGKVSNQRARVEGLNKEIASLKATIGAVGKFKSLQKELQSKLKILDDLRSAKTGPVRLLDELSLSLPAKLWLESFEEKGGSVNISGVAVDEETVADFMKRLDRSSYYKNVELKQIKLDQKGERKLQEFALKAQKESPLLPVQQGGR